MHEQRRRYSGAPPCALAESGMPRGRQRTVAPPPTPSLSSACSRTILMDTRSQSHGSCIPPYLTAAPCAAITSKLVTLCDRLQASQARVRRYRGRRGGAPDTSHLDPRLHLSALTSLDVHHRGRSGRSLRQRSRINIQTSLDRTDGRTLIIGCAAKPWLCARVAAVIWRTVIGLDSGWQEVQIGQFWGFWGLSSARRSRGRGNAGGVRSNTVPVLAADISRYQGNIRAHAQRLGGCQLRTMLE